MVSRQSTLRWGILGTGDIATDFATALPHSATGRLQAVASRDAGRAAAFAARHGGTAHGSYDALIADPQVDAVYVALPHTEHARWTLRAVEAGKGVLCEKPFGTNHAEAMAVVERARERGVFLMEAFMYRCYPQTAALVELVRSGRIGEVRMIESSFGYHSSFAPGSRTFANALAGGGIMDVGCYPVSAARLVAGAALGLPFAEPLRVQGAGRIGKTGVDEWAAATLEFPGGIVARLATAVSVTLEDSLHVFGTKGRIRVLSPWYGPGLQGGRSAIEVTAEDGTAETITIDQPQWMYALEADTVAAHWQRGEAPAMPLEDTLGNMKALDAWRAALGLVFAPETPEGYARPLSGAARPAPRPDAGMPTGTVPGVARPVARMVMGVDNQQTFPHAAALFDDYIERGGNCFDTARVYEEDGCETLFGQWLSTRGLRDEIVLICKGAHTPNCTPDAVRRELEQSFEALRTDRADIYFLHRDNPEVPVGEFVDVLDALHREGRIGVFGGSNWSLERFRAANDYARQNGKAGFTVLSNNLALARMVNPVWTGCVSAHGPDWLRYLEESGTALFAWSSTARGFFTDRAGPDRREDPELVNAWYADDNFERRRRAIALAEAKGTSPVQIAMAWVLSQPFATFALSGPRSIAETRRNADGLALTLTRDERDWLDLRRDSL
ncbi:aldo/keto reductase [Inquilinus sp.]|uniref:aldo/keto reductase n=1 Tax=Inquilinus sp. TaxID=1932117 RepID=UPI0031D3CD7F